MKMTERVTGMSDCLFCKIAAGEIPSSFVYEDEQVLAFEDINPQAPVHLLVIPKEHIASASEINAGNASQVAACFQAIAKIAAQRELGGYRVITNCGPEGGQTVFHLHFHILAGKRLGEKLV